MRAIPFLGTFITAICVASTTAASVSVYVSATPNPFPSGATIGISVSASWDQHSHYCTWPETCWPEAVEVTISGSDGFSGFYSGYLWGATSGNWSFYDSTPGQTMEAVSYSVSVRVYYLDYEMWWWYSDEGSGWSYAEPQPPPPPLTISGPNTVWWFEGQNPTGYDTAVTLTSDAGSSTQWSITQGDNKVQLSSSSGGSVTVTPTGIISSGYVGDIVIVASAPGYESGAFNMTARRPYRLVFEGNLSSTNCDAAFGYRTLLTYTIQDNLLDPIPSSVPLNETWIGPKIDLWAGNNWIRTDSMQKSFTTPVGDPARFADGITGGRHVADSPNPMPECNGDGTAVDEWEQRWRVGSLSLGAGRTVQENTLERRRAFALHSNIRY